MEIQLINGELLAELHRKAAESERLRQNFDLRTTPEDGSQRMLNVLEVLEPESLREEICKRAKLILKANKGENPLNP